MSRIKCNDQENWFRIRQIPFPEFSNEAHQDLRFVSRGSRSRTSNISKSNSFPRGIKSGRFGGSSAFQIPCPESFSTLRASPPLRFFLFRVPPGDSNPLQLAGKLDIFPSFRRPRYVGTVSFFLILFYFPTLCHACSRIVYIFVPSPCNAFRQMDCYAFILQEILWNTGREKISS